MDLVLALSKKRKRKKSFTFLKNYFEREKSGALYFCADGKVPEGRVCHSFYCEVSWIEPREAQRSSFPFYLIFFLEGFNLIVIIIIIVFLQLHATWDSIGRQLGHPIFLYLPLASIQKSIMCWHTLIGCIYIYIYIYFLISYWLYI